MATKLRKLVINEISLVDRGSNQHAFITLFKRDVPEDEATQRLEKDDRVIANQIVKLAYDIASGASGNHATKGIWYGAIQKLAEEERQPHESAQQAFSRFVTEDADGRVMFAAWKSATGSDFQPPAVTTPTLKSDSAYAALKRLVADICAEHPDLTEHQGFAKAYAENPELAARTKTEQAFA